jgi:hypothetical protein
MIVPLEEERATPLLRLGLAARVTCLLVQSLRPRVERIGLRKRVELHSQVGTRERNAGADVRGRPRRIRSLLRPTKRIESALQVTSRRECRGELALGGDSLHERARTVQNRQRFAQRGARRRVIPAPHLELAQAPKRIRGLRPHLPLAPCRQRVPV